MGKLWIIAAFLTAIGLATMCAGAYLYNAPTDYSGTSNPDDMERLVIMGGIAIICLVVAICLLVVSWSHLQPKSKGGKK